MKLRVLSLVAAVAIGFVAGTQAAEPKPNAIKAKAMAGALEQLYPYAAEKKIPEADVKEVLSWHVRVIETRQGLADTFRSKCAAAGVSREVQDMVMSRPPWRMTFFETLPADKADSESMIPGAVEVAKSIETLRRQIEAAAKDL